MTVAKNATTPLERTGRGLLNSGIMTYPILAAKFSVCEAMLIQQTHFLSATWDHVVDGVSWFYRTQEEWVAELGFFSINTVRNALSSLLEYGVLVIGNFNKLKFDRTRWYRLDYLRLHTLLIEAGVEREKLTWIECAMLDTRGQPPVQPRDLTNSPVDNFVGSNCDVDHGEIIIMPSSPVVAPTDKIMDMEVYNFESTIPKRSLKDLKDLKIKTSTDEQTVCAGSEPPIKAITDRSEKEEAMKLDKGVGAKDILAQHRKQREARAEELKDAKTPKQLELLWRHLLVTHCEVKMVKAFGMRDYGQLKQITKVAGPDHIAGLLTCVCSEWIAFTKYASSHYGAFNCPLQPTLPFLTRFVDAAVNYWLTSTPSAHAAINCTDSPAPSKPAHVTLDPDPAPTVTPAPAKPKTTKTLVFGGKAKAAREAALAQQPIAPPVQAAPVLDPDWDTPETEQMADLEFLKNLDLDAL